MEKKIYGKEKTIKSYQDSGNRVQLVIVGLDLPFTAYEVRHNRRIEFRSFDLNESCKFFRNYILDIVNQLSLC